MQESNNEKLNLFCEINAIESAIKSQIVTAINPMYFNELKNNSTATIEHTIARMVMHFFQQYGQVPYHQLQEELKVRNFVYNISDPPIIRFNAIEDLSNLSNAANFEKLHQQIINYGLEIQRQNNEFETSMTTWFQKAPADSTWSNFKKYFADAHTNLIKVSNGT